MNTPPHSESGPSCSGSVASLKEMDKMGVREERDDRHPPTPPLDGSHPTFFLGPVDERLRECGTVLEEDEDGEIAVADASSSIASSNDGSWDQVQVDVTPATPPVRSGTQTPQAPGPGLKRRTSSRLSILLRRGSSSNDNLASLSATSPVAPPRKGFLFHRKSANNSPVLAPGSGTTNPQPLALPQALENSPLTPGRAAPPPFLGKGPRGRRSSSMTGLSKLIGSNQISHPAPAGAGLKSRRITLHGEEFPEIEKVQLSSKYSNHSSVPLKKKQVGEGATAIVTLVHMANGPPDAVFAVKEFRKRSSKEDEEEYEEKVKSEFFVSKSLKHPNIVQTEDLCMKYGRWCHVMEYCSGGDLFSLIQKGFMKEAEKLCCFKQLLRGVSYLHSHGIAHRDIKPENLLMSSDGHLKITDFGVSEIFSGKHPGVAGIQAGVDMGEIRRCTPGICGSVPYLSPEVLEKKDDYDPRKLDVWSCAIVFMTLHYGGAPWNKASEEDPMFSKFAFSWTKWLSTHPDGIIKSDETELPGCRLMSDMKLGLRRLLFRMTHLDPSKRISIEEAVNDRYITGIECCTFDDEYQLGKNLDVAKKDACKTATKLNVKRMHNHLPPKHL